MTHTKWEDIRHKANPDDVARARKQQEREYNRLYWRIVRFFDRLRSR